MTEMTLTEKAAELLDIAGLTVNVDDDSDGTGYARYMDAMDAFGEIDPETSMAGVIEADLPAVFGALARMVEEARDSMLAGYAFEAHERLEKVSRIASLLDTWGKVTNNPGR